VPVPRPADREWIDRERSAIARLPDDANSSERQDKLIRSPEFQQVRLYDHLQEILSALQCATSATLSTPREMYCWAKAGMLLGDHEKFSSGIKTLLIAKRLPATLAKTMNRTSTAGVILWFEIYSNAILNDFMIPYLAAQVGPPDKK
jgi:hypothetical protein